jgi:predicted CXXCH cytochrome family protein
MTQHRDRKVATPEQVFRRLVVMLLLVVLSATVVDGCSTEGRYRIKTIIFTGVPPLHEGPAMDGAEQAQPTQTANAEQIARQQEHRESLRTRYWQHGPFAAGQCERCHSLGQSKSFLGNQATTNEALPSVTTVSASSRLLFPAEQLCVTCHLQHGASSVRDLGLQQHLPAAAGACTGCHNPHQSLRQYMLLRANNHELCSGCHEPDTLSPVHTKNPGQDCIVCHNAHVGVTSKLLSSDARDLTLLYGGGNHD